MGLSIRVGRVLTHRELAEVAEEYATTVDALSEQQRFGSAECAGEWGYPSFHRFRKRVAWAEGIDLEDMVGYEGIIPDILRAGDPVPWSDCASPLAPLLYHSDNEGLLTPEECARMVERLHIIVEAFSDGVWGKPDYDKQEGRAFVAGMRLAVERGVPLLFG